MSNTPPKNGRWRRIRALNVKEFYQIARDPSSLLISVVLPLLLMFLYGFGVSLDLNHLRLGLVLEDTSPDAQSFAKSLTNSRYFDVQITRDRRQLTPEIVAGNIRGMVVVPSYFTAFRHRQDNVAPIQVIADGSETNTANFVQNYVFGAWQNWLQQEAISSNLQGLPLATSETRYWYNEQLESRNFLLPGSLAIIMTLIGTLLTSLVIAREWERGTMEAIISTPVDVTELLIGKLVPYFVLGMISMIVCVVIAVFFYQVPFRGSFWLLALVTAIFLLTALGLGLLISTLSHNQFVASQVAVVAAFLPAYILSGFIFEIASMPMWVQCITYIIPARYFVNSLQTLFLVGNIWPLILFNLIPMILMAVLLLYLTARNTVKRLD
jgi:ABC-2 type transport system permease protein